MKRIAIPNSQKIVHVLFKYIVNRISIACKKNYACRVAIFITILSWRMMIFVKYRVY